MSSLAAELKAQLEEKGIPTQQMLGLPQANRTRRLDRVIEGLDADHERGAHWNALAAKRDAEGDADPTLLFRGP